MPSELPPAVPPAVELVGQHVRLEPLTEAGVPELARALHDQRVFAGGWGGGAAAHPATQAGMEQLLASYVLSQQRPYLVRLASGQVVGTSTLSEFEPVKERLHLGWTAYAPAVWGTVVNPETKLLLLGHCFDHGWGRVKIQADALNDRSRAAIVKLGATFEGITRRDQRRADGSWRDCAVHSIIVEDWPRVREGLQRRIAQFVDERVDHGAADGTGPG